MLFVSASQRIMTELDACLAMMERTEEPRTPKEAIEITKGNIGVCLRSLERDVLSTIGTYKSEQKP